MKKFISLLLASLIFTLPLYGQSQSLREDKVFKALLNKGVNACLSNGAPILGEDISRGSTPLIIAAQLGDTALVKELLAKGADINARNAWNWTALFEAAEQGHSEALALLLEAGSELNTVEFEYDWTPLIAAAERGHGDIVRMLVEKGAFIHAKDRFGDTALLKAAQNGDIDMLGFLLSKGAHLGNRDFKGASALIIAAKGGKTDLVRFLLKAGSSPWEIDDESKTARDRALEEEELEIAGILEEAEEWRESGKN